MYLGGAGCGDGKTERELRRRVEAGANAWRAVEGGYGRPADRKKTEGQGHEHLCHTGMSVRNGNLGTDRPTTTKAASVRKISKSNEGRYAKNGGVKGRDGSAEELDRETGGSRLRWAGHVERMADARPANRAAYLREQGETRGVKAEMGGLY